MSLPIFVCVGDMDINILHVVSLQKVLFDEPPAPTQFFYRVKLSTTETVIVEGIWAKILESRIKSYFIGETNE